MTPKEKAKKLIDMAYNKINNYPEKSLDYAVLKESTEISLMFVCERKLPVLYNEWYGDEDYHFIKDTDKVRDDLEIENEIEYWEEVKTELKKALHF